MNRETLHVTYVFFFFTCYNVFEEEKNSWLQKKWRYRAVTALKFYFSLAAFT